MSDNILNTEIANKLEERLLSLANKHTEISKRRETFDCPRKEAIYYDNVSCLLGVGGFISNAALFGAGAAGMIVAAKFGHDLGGFGLAGAAAGFGAYIGGLFGLNNLYVKLVDKVHDKLGINS